MGTKRSVSSSPHILQAMMYVAIITINMLLISETPCKGHTQNTLFNGEKLDTLTKVHIPITQCQPTHGLIPTRLHLSPMLPIASQRTSMRPLSHNLPTPGSWLALFAWNLILLQAGDLELNPGPRAVRRVSYPCTVCSRDGVPTHFSMKTVTDGRMLSVWTLATVHTPNRVSLIIYGSALTVVFRIILI